MPQANRAISAAGWLLVAIGGVILAPALTVGAAGGVFTIVTGAVVASIFLLPGALLLFLRSALAATIALSINMIFLGLSAIGACSMLLSQGIAATLPLAVSGIGVFGAIALLCWRARAAAYFLKPLKDTTVFD